MDQLDDIGRRKTLLSFLLSLSVCANIFEQFIPALPMVPWIKPGIANAFTMVAIDLYGLPAGLTLTILRTLIAGFFTGVPITSILIGGSGGIVSTFIMATIWKMGKGSGKITFLGVGMAGAFTHTLTQIEVVNLLFIQNNLIYWQIPILGPISIFSGALTGIIATTVKSFIEKDKRVLNNSYQLPDTKESYIPIFKIILLLIFSSLLFLISLPIHLAILPLLLALILILRRTDKLKMAIKFIPLLLITFLINSFTTAGTCLDSIPSVTFEGINKGLFLSLRFINLMLLSFTLITSNDLRATLLLIGKRVPKLLNIVEIALRAIEAIPSIVLLLKDFMKNIPERGFINKLRHINIGLSRTLSDVLSKV